MWLGLAVVGGGHSHSPACFVKPQRSCLPSLVGSFGVDEARTLRVISLLGIAFLKFLILTCTNTNSLHVAVRSGGYLNDPL